jgi:hypothetical protein
MDKAQACLCLTKSVWKYLLFCTAMHTIKKYDTARRQWLTPVILAIQQAEIRRMEAQSQPRQIVC